MKELSKALGYDHKVKLEGEDPDIYEVWFVNPEIMVKAHEVRFKEKVY